MRALVLCLLVACGFPRPDDVPLPDTTSIEAVSGMNQVAVVATPLPEPLAVRVSNDGVPISAVRVVFSITDGGGALSTETAFTDANGMAAATWTLGTLAGPNAVSVQADGVSGSSEFAATGIPGAPSQLLLTAGDGQSEVAGSMLSAPFVITAADVHGNPVPEVPVGFGIVSGNGSLADDQVTTDAQGRAQTTLTLGTTAGTNRVQAMVPGASPVIFSATGLVGVPHRIVMVSGNVQAQTVASTLTDPLVIAVQDANGNGVPGFAVSFAVTAGGGQIDATSTVTNTLGRAETHLKLGTLVGPNTVEARANTLVGSPVAFSASGLVGPPAITEITSGNQQTGTAGAALPAAFVATVRDAHTNPVSGVTVEFVVTAGGGSMSSPSATTNAQGSASSTLTLGAAIGTNTVEARVQGLNPATFAANGLSGTADRMVLVSGNSQSGTAGSPLAAPFVVRVQDNNGNPIASFSLQFVIMGGGGQLSVTNTNTGADGRASTLLTLGATVGVNTVEARGTGVSGSPIVFSASGVAGSANKILLTSGNNQTNTVGATLAPLVVSVQDVNGNAIANHPVSFEITAGNGNLSTQNTTTDANGRAQTTLTLGTTAGLNRVQAKANGLTGSPVVFDSTGIADSATQIALAAGNDQTAKAGAQFGAPLAVTVRDAHGNPVNGFPVAFVVTAGGGSVTAPSSTNALGIAQTVWTAGSSGINTVEARAVGLAGSPVVFRGGVADFALKADFLSINAGVFTEPSGVANPDLNGDGKPDLVIVEGESAISVYLNSTPALAATPSFGNRFDFFPDVGIKSVAVGDFNGDVKPDLVLSNFGNQQVTVMLNSTVTGSSTPTFAAPVRPVAGSVPRSVAVGDFNGDGKPDIVVANEFSDSVSILLDQTATGATTASFAAHVDFPTGSNPLWVAVDDFNSDGKPDLVVVSGASAMSVLLNTTPTGSATPSFQTKVDFPADLIPQVVITGDFNGDGRPDFVVGNRTTSTVSVFFNTTTSATVPSFAPRIDFPAAGQDTSKLEGLATADFDADGRLDLAVTGSGEDSVSVLLNFTPVGGSSAKFGAPIKFATGDLPQAVSTCDFNADGKPDLSVANGKSKDASVLLGR